jgi:hypothetical protein
MHEGAQVRQPRGKVREGVEPQPGQQQAGADEGLQEPPEVVEPLLPAGVVGPGGMLAGRSSGGTDRLRWDRRCCRQDRGL